MASNTPTGETEQESANHAFSPLSILRTLWKRKARIAIAAVLFAVAGMVVVRLLPAVFLAESVVLIDTQKIPEKFVSATVASDLEDRIAAIRQTLLSSTELKKVIDDFGLYREERKNHFEEEILDMMRKDISITMEAVGSGKDDKKTAAFRIGYQGSDPALVMRVANRLTDLYVEQNLKTREEQAEGTSEFLDTQLSEAKKGLDQLEAAVSTFKLRYNGELPEQEQELTNALSRLQTELEANRDAVNRSQQTRVILEGNLAAMDVTLSSQTHAWEQARLGAGPSELLFPGGSSAPGKRESQVLQEQLDVLRLRYREDYPDVIRLREQVERVKRLEEQRQAEESKVPKVTAAAGARDVPPVREPPELARTREQVAGLRAQIKAADKELEDRTAEQKRILSEIGSYQSRIERLPVRQQEMARITRDYEISKENYKSLLDKKMAAEMALDMERRQQSERFTVLDRAQVPEKPTKPNRPLLYAVVAGLSLVLGGLFGFVAELRQNVFLGEWELPEGVPVLARLPYIEVSGPAGGAVSPRGRRWFARSKALVSACVAVMLAAGSAGAVMTVLLRKL